MTTKKQSWVEQNDLNEKPQKYHWSKIGWFTWLVLSAAVIFLSGMIGVLYRNQIAFVFSPVPTTTPLLVPTAPPTPEPTPTLVFPPEFTLPSVKITMQAEGKINVRSGPSTRYKVIGYLEPGDVVEIKNVHGEWFQIAGENVKGYAWYRYLRETVSNETTSRKQEFGDLPGGR